MEKHTGTLEFVDQATKKLYSGVQFEYTSVTAEDMLETLSGNDMEAVNKIVSNYNRILKTDARNTASIKEQARLGINQRVATPEQKEALKAERATNKALLDRIKSLSPERLAELGLA